MADLLNLLDHVELFVMKEYNFEYHYGSDRDWMDDGDDDGIVIYSRNINVKTTFDEMIFRSSNLNSRWFEFETEKLTIEFYGEDSAVALEVCLEVMAVNPHVKMLDLTEAHSEKYNIGADVPLLKEKFPNVTHLKANDIYFGHGKYLNGYESVELGSIYYHDYMEAIKTDIKSLKCTVHMLADHVIVLPTCEYYEVTFNSGQGPCFKSCASTTLASLS
jgi:hypothetical protein